MSFTVKISSQLANSMCYGAVFGGLGYLGARAVNLLGAKAVSLIDPRVALVCSAAAGASTALFFYRNAPLLSKVMGLGLLLVAPFKLCEWLKLPSSLQTCLIITGVTAACALFIQSCQENYAYRQKLAKIDEFELSEMQMKADLVQKMSDVLVDDEAE